MSKLQLTVPKAIADRYRIRPGDELEWIPAGDAIRVIPRNSRGAPQKVRSVEERLTLFHKMLQRQRRREKNSEEVREPMERPPEPHEIERGWRREDLCQRGRTR